jgi:hypothetical protein
MEINKSLFLPSWRQKLTQFSSLRVRNISWFTNQSMTNLTLSGISWPMKKSEDSSKSLEKMLSHSSGVMMENSLPRHPSNRSLSQRAKKPKREKSKQSHSQIKLVSMSFHHANCALIMTTTEHPSPLMVSQTSSGYQTRTGLFSHHSLHLKMSSLESLS